MLWDSRNGELPDRPHGLTRRVRPVQGRGRGRMVMRAFAIAALLALASCGSSEKTEAPAAKPSPAGPRLGDVALDAPLRATDNALTWSLELAPDRSRSRASPAAGPRKRDAILSGLAAGRWQEGGVDHQGRGGGAGDDHFHRRALHRRRRSCDRTAADRRYPHRRQAAPRLRGRAAGGRSEFAAAGGPGNVAADSAADEATNAH